MRKLLIVQALCFAALAVLPVIGQTPVDAGKVVPSDRTVAALSPIDERYRIGFQDVLDVQIFRHPELSQRVPVNPNGTILLHRLEKPVVAVCKTGEQVADEIAAAYEEKILREARVTVTVDQKSQSIGIIGAIEKPGSYLVARRIHLLEMLAMASGPNKESGTQLRVVRAGSRSTCKEETTAADDQVSFFDFKLKDVQEGRQIFWMQPGDIVLLLKADLIYMYGNVNRQGAIPVKETITLTQAIVTAEGLKPATKKDKIRVLRQRPGSAEREEIVYNLDDIDKGKVKDPILEPNDIVAISQDTTKSILLGLANSFKATVPNVLYRIP